jgi:hypothetical protein
MEIQISERDKQATPAIPAATIKKIRRGAKLRLLHAYLEAGRHLRDDTVEITPENFKGLVKIASEVGLRSAASVSHLIHREFPEIVQVLTERDRTPHRRAPKRERLIKFIAEDRHLLNTEDEASTDNLKTQSRIALELGMDQKSVSNFLREHRPDIAAMMTPRKADYRGRSI